MTDPVIPTEAVEAAEVEPWLQQCGSCDYALPMGCVCPTGDYRTILLKVWEAYERSQAEAKALAETGTKIGHTLGRAEALALRCGCAVWPEHTLSHHARKEDSTRPAPEPEQRPDDDPPPHAYLRWTQLRRTSP